MGRKKKRNRQKIWCFYCDREFNDEKVLTDHQKARHFKCPECYKRLLTCSGLQVHMTQVHKSKIDKVPNAKEGRDDPTLDVYGMSGIPEKFLHLHGGDPAPKRSRAVQQPRAPPQQMGMMPHMGPRGYMMPPMGMPPMGMPPGAMPRGWPPAGLPPGMPPTGMPPTGMPPGMPPRGMMPRGMPIPAGMPPAPRAAVPAGLPPPLPPVTAISTPTNVGARTSTPAAAGAGAGAGAGASAASGAASAEPPLSVGPNTQLVHPPSQKLSLEEIRAALPKYRYDEKAAAAAASALESRIAQALQ